MTSESLVSTLHIACGHFKSCVVDLTIPPNIDIWWICQGGLENIRMPKI
jgi:hypothetical protein